MTPALSLWLSLCFGPPGPAPASWADANLPVRDALEVWLDATRLGAARAVEGQEGPALGGLDVWWDSSGQGRHAQQAVGSNQPVATEIGEHPVIRFDGQDDHLRVVGLDGKWGGLTVFIVAVPRSNPGDFRGLLAGNKTARRDWQSGFTLDQGPIASPAFEALNWEGAGFMGAQDLFDAALPFGDMAIIDAMLDPAGRSGRVAVNGKETGSRPYNPAPLDINEITVGSRYYTNGSGAQQARGSFEGDVREVLVYSRALTDAERVQVRDYLKAKHEPFRIALGREANAGRDRLQQLKTVADSPPVQVFVPGFRARELPIDLTNINNIRYRPDGRLVALAYSGDIYFLDDTDGDGLEDRATRWWENRGNLRGPIGMALVPPGGPLGDAIVVASKGKLSAICDKDGDGVAEEEKVLAQGWKEITQAVDTLGVARDGEGNWYFGLGTADYTNGHLVGPDGKSKYDLKSERGTIIKLAPDFSKREIVCTGIRFPVGLAINRAGDLFATDQEGATWLPNGNPFDELLHIQPGRHYGFPPRHPQHLPGVIDEPSVFDYGPQHQSTCGLIFNEPTNGGPTFGPEGWKDNAIVCGYSRGKLYRTELVKTAPGYVARTELFANMNMLPADSCVTPKGALLVAAHGGSPDWGSGPEGHGKLFRIEPIEGEIPRPTLAWADGSEVKVAFDRPLDPGALRDLASRTEIVHGSAVSAGDRFEVHRPGYAVVARQVIAPRRLLEANSVRVSPDLRTLSFVTSGHTVAEPHAISFPDVASPAKAEGLPRHPQIDLAYDLCGVRATWTPRGASEPEWIGWLPHLDLAVARTFTAGSPEHDRLWGAMKQPGVLVLETQLNLDNMLRPVVQPGSSLDFEWPQEVVTLAVKGSGSISLTGPAGTAESGEGDAVRWTVRPEKKKPVALQIRLEVPAGDPALEVSWSTAEDDRPRALPLRRMIQPWVPTEDAPASLATAAEARKIPELEGGRWAEGRKAFYHGAVACGSCHMVNGRGGTIGPDLSNLIHRDFASVWRDVTRPSDAIHPDYIAHAVTLDDGRVLTGTLQNRGDDLLIGDNQGRVTVVPRKQVEDVKASTVSVMPEDLLKALGEPALKDILTFLLTEPPAMPEYGKGSPPPARSRAEVEAALKGSEEVKAARPLRIVLVDGAKDHGPGEHDYPAWRPRWADLLGGAEQVTVVTARDWPSPEQWVDADVVVFYQRGAWNADRAKDLDAFLARGGGAVYLHWAVTAEGDHEGLAKRIGLASLSNGKTKFRHGPLDLDFAPGKGHPIVRGFDKVAFVDESYWELIGDPKDITPLAVGVEEGQPRPLFWTREVGKGRVFVSILGHYSWTFDDPLFRLLTLRGILWSAREPVDRFNDLIFPGARLQQ